jgi:hypothetical protein
MWYNLSFLARNQAPSNFHPTGLQANGGNPTSWTNIAGGSIHGRLWTPMEKDLILERWYAMTMEYSSCGFFNPTNNHAALAGVVRLV